MSEETPTPRTDKAVYGIAALHGDTGFDGPPKNHVSADFARGLERELAAAEAALTESLALNMNWVADAEPEDLAYYSEYKRVIKQAQEVLKKPK